jgi:hypothetical protein
MIGNNTVELSTLIQFASGALAKWELGAIVIVLSCTLSGCASFLDKTSSGLDSYVGAAPIDQATITAASAPSPVGGVKLALGNVLINSEQKCEVFSKNLTMSNVGSNTFLDVTTTLFSAAATAVNPIKLAHALSGVSTVSSGSKTAINADIFAKATIANLAQAINATYYKDLKTYEDQLGAAQPDSLVGTVEIAKILSIHKECALDTAEASISSTLGSGPPASAPAAVTSKLVTISLTGASAHPGDNLQIVATSTSDPTLSLTASYSVASAAETPATIAKGMVAAIQADSGFSQAGITSTQNASPNEGSFVVQSPTASGIKLGLGPSPPSAEKITITDQTAAAKPSASTGTKGVVPGRSLLY